MAKVPPGAEVTICVLLYGDYVELAKRVLGSIQRYCPRSQYRLVVGANAPGVRTEGLVRGLREAGAIDHLIVSGRNLQKCPMMRRMFRVVRTPWIWWFDDDSYVVSPTALETWLHHARRADPAAVLWGQEALCGDSQVFVDLPDPVRFVRSAPWSRGLPPPAWRPGGKGEFNFRGLGVGDGRWFFVLGGCWLIRTAAVRALDWPDRRLRRLGDDVFLCEAIRQHGWRYANIGCPGVRLNTERRRGEPSPTRVELRPAPRRSGGRRGRVQARKEVRAS
jgi:hypothetical protein